MNKDIRHSHRHAEAELLDDIKKIKSALKKASSEIKQKLVNS